MKNVAQNVVRTVLVFKGIVHSQKLLQNHNMLKRFVFI